MADEEDKPPQCHCQAGRLLIVVGDPADKSIGAALDWAHKSPVNHLHRVAFRTRLSSTPSLDHPYVPDKTGWDRYPKGKKKNPIENLVATEFRDCCHFEEVVIIAHGGQVGLYNTLANDLPALLDRPVVKLVFWVCGGSRDNYPFTESGRHTDFLRICQLVRPQDCPCGCDLEDCHLHDADGKPAGRCPSAKDQTIVLSAGYYTAGSKTVPSSLGMQPKNPDPFGAPDGQLIQTTVTGGKGSSIATASTAVTGQSVLGTSVRTDNSLKNPNPGGYGFDPKMKIGDAKYAKAPKAASASYQGPKVGTDCPHLDGCFPGR